MNNSRLFVVGSNLSLTKRWQINKPRKTAININIRRQQQGHGSSVSHTATELPQQSLKSAEGPPPPSDVLPCCSPPPSVCSVSPAQSALGFCRKMNAQPAATGKRVSLVDARDSVDGGNRKDPVLLMGVKKRPRHISQLNSSENCSMITSDTTTSTEEHKSSAQRNAEGRGGGRRRRRTSYARNKTFHLFRKLIQRHILQIPRLSLPRFHEITALLSLPPPNPNTFATSW